MPRLAGIRGYEEQKQKLADLASVNNPVPEKLAYADRPKAVQEQPASVLGAAKASNPALDKMTWKNTGIVPMAGQGEYRTQALRDMNEAEFAKNQGAMNASDYEYWTQQVKANPESTYAILNQMNASQETPEEKRKRERREQLGEVFNNLGNVIGNAANLYYTHRGGQYIDLNTENEKRRERMRRIKEKQDALKQKQDELLGKAKIADVKAKREEATAKAKAEADAKAKELEYKRDLALKQIEHAFKIGQIDAQTKARFTEQANKLKNDKEPEAFKQTNRLELNDGKGGGNGKKKSTYTYNGVVYNKGDLSSMVNLYNKLRYDGYAMPKVKGNNVNQYVDAIANSMSKGTWNMGDFSKGAEAKYPNIIDSDMNQEGGYGVLAWKGEDETNKTYWD